MADYSNPNVEYPLPRLNGLPGIVLPEDFSLEAADRSLNGVKNNESQPTTVLSPPNGRQKSLIRSPDPKNYGEAIARLGGAYSGPGFNTIFRPHFHKDPEDLLPESIRKNFPGGDLLQLNLTHELWTFPSIKTDLGKIPNRVADPRSEDEPNKIKDRPKREDVFLRGIPYTQIVRDVTDTTGQFKGGRIPVDALGKSKDPSRQKDIQDIHFEPGLLINIPESKPVTDKPMISRMASIPHGTTINAQGPAATVNVDGKAPDIPAFNPRASTPFSVSDGGFIDFKEFDALNANTTRLPQDLKPFIDRNSTESITQQMIRDPNTLIREHNNNKTFTQFVKFKVSTLPTQVPKDPQALKAFKEQSCPHLAARRALNEAINGLKTVPPTSAIDAAKKTLNDALSHLSTFVPQNTVDLSTAPAVGTSNIAQLDGALAGPDANPNAKTAKVESTFWISNVAYTIEVKENWTPGNGKEPLQVPPIMNPLWHKDTVPSKFIFPTDKAVEAGKYIVEATQVQYSQTVDLVFNGLVWPHISVATVVPVRPVLVNFAKRTS